MAQRVIHEGFVDSIGMDGSECIDQKSRSVKYGVVLHSSVDLVLVRVRDQFVDVVIGHVDLTELGELVEFLDVGFILECLSLNIFDLFQILSGHYVVVLSGIQESLLDYCVLGQEFDNSDG